MPLREQASSGVRWTGAASIVMAVLQVTQTAILVRLLQPEDFGLMAMIMVVLGLGQAYADMGMSNAIIHRQDTTREQLSSLYWLNLMAGTAIFVLMLVAAPIAAQLFGEPRLREPMRWASLMFLIVPLGQQFQILLQKDLHFRALAVVEVSAAFAAMAASIGFALAGLGVYALIWGQLIAVAVSTTSVLGIGLRHWRPQLRFRRRELEGYLSFGLFQMGERSINYFGTKVDQLLIGSMLGAEILGFYSVAFNLVMLPILRLNPIVTRVAFPVFARIQHDVERLKRGYLLALQVLSLINFPIFLGLAVLAPWLVPMLFGDGWQATILLVQILSAVALLRSVANPLGSLLLAKGRADLGFYWNALLLMTQTAGVYCGARLGGAAGVAGALLALQLTYFGGSYYFLVRRLLGHCLPEYLWSMAPQFVTAGTMAVTVAAMMSLAGTPTLPILMAVIAGGATVYSGLHFVFCRRQLLEIRRLGLGR